MTERDELHKQICSQVYQLSVANMYEIQAIIEDMLKHPQVDPEVVRGVKAKNDIVSTPLTDSGPGTTWLEEKFIPKRTKKGTQLYGPYIYEYRWKAGRRQFVKYHGKVKGK